MAIEKTINADTMSFKSNGAIPVDTPVVLDTADTTGKTVKVSVSRTEHVIGHTTSSSSATGEQLSVVLNAPTKKMTAGSGGVTIGNKLAISTADYISAVAVTLGNTTGTRVQIIGVAMETANAGEKFCMLMTDFYADIV